MNASGVDYVVGTGGIGKGILFRFYEDRMLGRNESRLAMLSDAQDYCKLHIILHYIAVFAQGSIPVYAIGAVGNDATGEEVLRLMQGAGINTDHVNMRDDASTLFSVCYTYPNGEGGNITTGNSASQLVSVAQIDHFFSQAPKGKKGMVVAAPEVPVDTRRYLLQKGRELGCFNSAALLSSEAEAFLGGSTITTIDLLAINQDEAAAITGLESGDSVAARCYEKLQRINSELMLAVTRGAEGSEIFTPHGHWRYGALGSEVCSTAGAGDCYFGTLLWALIAGMNIEPADTAGADAATLASACAAMKVQSKHTINFEINSESLCQYLKNMHFDALRKTVESFKGGWRLI